MFYEMLSPALYHPLFCTISQYILLSPPAHILPLFCCLSLLILPSTSSLLSALPFFLYLSFAHCIPSLCKHPPTSQHTHTNFGLLCSLSPTLTFSLPLLSIPDKSSYHSTPLISRRPPNQSSLVSQFAVSTPAGILHYSCPWHHSPTGWSTAGIFYHLDFSQFASPACQW